MKFIARFVIPNVSAQKTGIDITKTYAADIGSHKGLRNFVVITSFDLERPILMEVSEFEYLEDRIVFRGWLNYNYTGESYLCRGAVELRSFL
jgi:hypothetical protein